MSSPRSQKPALATAPPVATAPAVVASGVAVAAAREYPAIRLLAAAGIVVGFVAGFAFNNFKADNSTRTLAMADKPRAAAAPNYTNSVDKLAADYSPMLAQD